MKRFLSSIMFVFMACFSAFSQSTQNSVVKEYNDAKKKTPLAGVEIVVNNAGSNVSAKNGKFVLSFRTLKPGDKVEVRKIEKAGYEIFNKDALDAWRIANDGSEFTIVLCKSAKFKALKDQYNAVASKSYAQQQKKDEQRLASLLKEGKLQQAEYENKLKELKDKYDEQLENLDNYIDRFARIDLETISKDEQKIIEMVKEGKIEEAIAAYEAMNLEEKYAQAVENIQTSEAAIKQLEQIQRENAKIKETAMNAVFRMNDVYMLKGGEDSYDKIETNLRNMAIADSTNTYVMEVYADFLREQNKIEKAHQLYEICMNQYTSNNDSLKVAHVANKYAGMSSSLREYNTAIKYFSKALQYVPYSAGDSIFHTQHFNIYLNMGGMYGKMGKYEDSFQILKKAEKELNQMSAYSNLEKDYSKLYGNLSLVKRYLKDMDGAKKYSLLSVTIKRKLSSMNNREESQNELYTSLFNLGNLYAMTESLDSALTILTEAKDICNNLYSHNPQKYINEVSSVKYTLGQIYYYQNKYDLALDVMLSCKDIREKLYGENARLYAEKLSACYNVLANVYDKIDDKGCCFEYYNKALSIYKKLYKDYNSPSSLKDIASVDINIGLSLEKQGEIDKAIPYYEEALTHYTTLIGIDNNIYADVYVGICYELANCYMQETRVEDALRTANLGLKVSPKDEDLLELKNAIISSTK